MSIRFDDIGNRLKAFRLGCGLSVEGIAQKLDISRTALYRIEKGEAAKIETRSPFGAPPRHSSRF